MPRTTLTAEICGETFRVDPAGRIEAAATRHDATVAVDCALAGTAATVSAGVALALGPSAIEGISVAALSAVALLVELWCRLRLHRLRTLPSAWTSPPQKSPRATRSEVSWGFVLTPSRKAVRTLAVIGGLWVAGMLLLTMAPTTVPVLAIALVAPGSLLIMALSAMCAFSCLAAVAYIVLSMIVPPAPRS